jgi:hypothetical protein
MANKTLVRWSILILRGKAVWLGDVEAASEAEAIAKGAEEFKRTVDGGEASLIRVNAGAVLIRIT